MNSEALNPLGVRVTGVAVGRLGTSDVDVLRHLLAEHGVAVLPGRRVGNDEFTAFLESLGDLMFTEGETPVEGYPDLNVITNVGRTTPPKSTFHVDTTYIPVPPAYTALRAVEVPRDGGQTLFSNQYRAYETLTAEDKKLVEHATVTHTVTGLDGIEGSAEHPLVLEHPVTGRTALYLTAPTRCTAVSGTTADEASHLIRRLVDHSTREDNVLRHSWSPDDVVIWDNRCVMHKADHTGVTGNRVMHRGMAGDRLARPR